MGGKILSREEQDVLKELNAPWITKDGYLDLTKFPIDSTLTQAVGNNTEDFRLACRTLNSMAFSGRTEAGVFLYGLLTFYRDNRENKEWVVEALGHVQTPQSATLLFDELEMTESSNSTRGYINAVLKALKGFPAELVEDGFERLLSDSRWSYRMKRKFRALLEEIEYRSWR